VAFSIDLAYTVVRYCAACDGRDDQTIRLARSLHHN